MGEDDEETREEEEKTGMGRRRRMEGREAAKTGKPASLKECPRM